MDTSKVLLILALVLCNGNISGLEACTRNKKPQKPSVNDIQKAAVPRPRLTKPELVRPELTKPGLVRPELVRPGLVKPGPVLTRPEQGQLLENPDFELPPGGGGWQCGGCVLMSSVKAYSGKYSALVLKHSASSHVSQSFPVKPGGRYHFSGVIQLLQDGAGVLFHQMDAEVHVQYDSGSPQVTLIGRLPHLRAALGWQNISGDFKVADKPVKNATVYIKPDSSTVKYRLDKASLTEVIADPQWRDKVNQRIDAIRKNNINFKFNVSEKFDPAKVQVLVNLTRHDFPFGSALDAKLIVDKKSKTSLRYGEFFYNLYKFAVLGNALKWQVMERHMNEIDFETGDAALKELSSHGIPVRGHCILWDVDRHEPTWLYPMNGQQVAAQVVRRMNYVVPHYKGKVVHWDVNNEELHGSFFENKTQDPDYLVKAFNMAHSRDPDVKLFTNDYSVVAYGESTQAYANLATHLIQQGAPIYGMGIQSHITGMPDVTFMERRLDTLASTGLHLWITELDITNENRTQRAEGYEDVFRLYFGHPAVEGVVMWGFWDKAHWRPQAAIVEGDDFKINEAGKRIINLLKHEWSTNESLAPKSHSDTQQIRAFQGQYNLTVLYDGHHVSSTQVYLHKGKDLDVSINVHP